MCRLKQIDNLRCSGGHPPVSSSNGSSGNAMPVVFSERNSTTEYETLFVQETLCSDSVAYLQHPTVWFKNSDNFPQGMHTSGGESPPEAKKIFGQWLRCVLHQILDLASSRSQTSRYIVLHVHQCASMCINVHQCSSMFYIFHNTFTIHSQQVSESGPW